MAAVAVWQEQGELSTGENADGDLAPGYTFHLSEGDEATTLCGMATSYFSPSESVWVDVLKPCGMCSWLGSKPDADL